MIRITGLSLPRRLVLAMATVCIAGPAGADVNLRVQSRPLAGPVAAYVRVTDGDAALSGLAPTDFALKLDGVAVDVFGFSLPPDEDPTQRKSIAFVINDYRNHGPAAEDAVRATINAMNPGDYASVVKYYMDVRFDADGVIDQEFTQIDGGSGTSTLLQFLDEQPRPGAAGLFDALIRAAGKFGSLPVPAPNGAGAIFFLNAYPGPFSMFNTASDTVAGINEGGIALFTVSVGDFAERDDMASLFSSFAESTGGKYVEIANGASAGEAFVALAESLDQEYRLTIPQSAIPDCGLHLLEITVRRQSMSMPFARCDTTPDQFSFEEVLDARLGSIIVSDPVMITSIESPTAIRVTDGEYSIGCGSTFTNVDGYVQPNDLVCVRHVASVARPNQTTTTLAVGGVSSWFSSTTAVDTVQPPVRPSGGGGGSIGLAELLIALGAWSARRRRRL